MDAMKHDVRRFLHRANGCLQTHLAKHMHPLRLRASSASHPGVHGHTAPDGIPIGIRSSPELDTSEEPAEDEQSDNDYFAYAGAIIRCEEFDGSFSHVIMLKPGNKTMVPAVIISADVMTLIKSAADHHATHQSVGEHRRKEEKELIALKIRLFVQAKLLDGAMSKILQDQPESDTAVTLRARQYALLENIARIDARLEDLEKADKDLDPTHLMAAEQAVTTLGIALDEAGFIDVEVSEQLEESLDIDTTFLEKLEAEGATSQLQGGPMSDVDKIYAGHIKAIDDNVCPFDRDPIFAHEEELYQKFKTILDSRAEIRHSRAYLEASKKVDRSSWSQSISLGFETHLKMIRSQLRFHDTRLNDTVISVREADDDFPLIELEHMTAPEAIRELAYHSGRQDDIRKLCEELARGERREVDDARLRELEVELSAADYMFDVLRQYCFSKGINPLPYDGMDPDDVTQTLVETSIFADRMLVRARLALEAESEAENAEAHISFSGPQQAHLLQLRNGVRYCRGVLYESRFEYEEHHRDYRCGPGPRLPWKNFGDDDGGSERDTSSGYAGGQPEAQIDLIEGLPGLAQRPAEPAWYRWRYSLGPYADNYDPPAAERWDAESVNPDDSGSIRYPGPEFEDNPVKKNDRRAWQKVTEAARNIW